jgi:hypothetical protein
MTRLDKCKTITEITKGIVEILALIVAGLWAFSNFQEMEKPSLELRGHSESVTKWYPLPDQNHCLGSFSVSFKNIGKKAIDFNSATMRIWIIEQPPLGKAITYLDPAYFESGKPTYEKLFSFKTDKNGLLGHFPPDAAGQTDFTFNFTKQTSNKIAFFSFEANGQGMKIRERRWSYVCDLDT